MAFAYGSFNYGDGYYSQTKYVDASASTACSGSVSSAAQRIQGSNGTVSGIAAVSSAGQRIHQSGTQNPLPSSSATATANYTTNASASDSAQTAMTTDGVRVQFSLSSVTTASVSTVSAQRIQQSAANDINAFATIAPVGNVVTAGGSADIAMTSSTAASAELVREVDASTASTASVTSAGLIVKDGDSSVTSSATVTAAGLRIGESSSSIDGLASVNTSGNITTNTSGDIASVTSVSSSCERIKETSGAVSSTSVIITIGREKWEPIASATDTWTDVTASSDIWTNVA